MPESKTPAGAADDTAAAPPAGATDDAMVVTPARATPARATPAGATDDDVVGTPPAATDDVEAVTRAVLTASRLLVAISARSLAAVEERVTLPQFRMLMVLYTRGATKLVTLAEQLQVAPSTAMRMVDRLIAAGLADRQTNPDNRRETLLRLTDEGRGTVENVTARRRTDIAAVVARLTPAQRTALVEALTAFSEAGGEPLAGLPDDSGPHPLGWPAAAVTEA